MAELPKFVRERLKAAPAGPHPDADLLAAFAEKRLGERERAQVLAHLSACAACREVVSLALPQEEEEAAAAAPHPARGWVLRWQTAAALAAVTVAAVALLTIPNSFFYRFKAPTQVAQAPAQKTAVTRQDENAPAAPAAETQTGSGRFEAKAEAPAEAPAKKAATARGYGGVGEISSELAKADTGVAEKDKLARSLPAPARNEDRYSAVAPAPPPPSVQPGAAAPAQQAYDFKTSGAAASDQAAAPAAGGAPGNTVGGIVATQKQQADARAKKAPATEQARESQQVTVAASSETVEVSAGAIPVQVAQWRTNAKGKLEHSRDAGQGWQTVHVAAGVTLNAVSAVGQQVWAGGHQQHLAVLYYSADAGAHWTRLDFTSPSAVPPADIVALQFTDAQHGVMTVVPAEAELRLRQIWTTADGGRTWTLPPLR